MSRVYSCTWHQRLLFMSVRFSYERFIESENAIVAVKRARTFHSCARGLALPGFHDAALNRIIMVLAWRDSRDTGRISYVSISGIRRTLVSDERANHLDRRCGESVRIRYRSRLPAMLTCYIVSDICQHSSMPTRQFSVSIWRLDSFQSPSNFLSRVTKAALRSYIMFFNVIIFRDV